MRRLAIDYLSFDDRLELGLASFDDMPEEQTTFLSGNDQIVDDQTEESVAEVITPTTKDAARNDDTAPMCYNCGNQTQRSGSCYVCTSCGSTTGCS